ncbi:ATP-binding protein [Amycolatopsis pithecellobii]|uniref:ATP-binding protein n=1 Tax=Amycolatopsis pithecellobii TaxID=664692 RepID=UPI00140E368F|nr:ATP-binding protein [Amycolatopsis pithecellobii]
MTPDLATLRFLDDASNVLFVGPPGVGKTMLATALTDARRGRSRKPAASRRWRVRAVPGDQPTLPRTCRLRSRQSTSDTLREAVKAHVS